MNSTSSGSRRWSARASRALERAAPADALEDIDAALALWRGPPLADIRDQPVAATAVPRLEELRLQALELRGDALLALGEHAVLLPDLDQLIADHPYRERLREQQIVALYRGGRQKDALEAFRAARATFVEELGVDPGPALQQLERSILSQDPALSPPEAEPARRTELPVPATPLVGRRLEIASVESLLRGEVRLVTLTGPGGTGKTRLALAVASALANELRDGATFVDLSSVTEAEALLPSVARALGVEGTDDELETPIVEYLRERSLLLVLDNLEQLGGKTQAVAALLARAPRLRVLATSRVPLRLSGEHDYPVPPLPVPVPAQHRFEEIVANEAVRLFAARARAVDPSFELTDENLESVVTVCRRLDGLPLALELAAAWIKVLSPSEIARRLGRALDVLVEGAHDLPARQQTMRATLDWSFELLDEPGQRTLADLSVFAGGWTIEDAEAVVGEDVVARLASLADHSLVRRRGDRFTVLETIREYAAERLHESGRAAAQRRRHAERFVAVAEGAYVDILAGGEAEQQLPSPCSTRRRRTFRRRSRGRSRPRMSSSRCDSRSRFAGTGSSGAAWRKGSVCSSARLRRPKGGRSSTQQRWLVSVRSTCVGASTGARQSSCRPRVGSTPSSATRTRRRVASRSSGRLRWTRAIWCVPPSCTPRQSTALSARGTSCGRGWRSRTSPRSRPSRATPRQRRASAAERSSCSGRVTTSTGWRTCWRTSLGRAFEVDDVAAARAALRESFDLGRRLGYQMLLAYLLGSAGNLAARRGESDEGNPLRRCGFVVLRNDRDGDPVRGAQGARAHARAAPRRTRQPNGSTSFSDQGRDEPLDAMLDAANRLLQDD